MSFRLFFMAMYRFVEVESTGYGVYDLYPYIKDFVSSVKVENGLILVYAVDELCSILTIEYEARLLSDLEILLSKLKVNDYVKSTLFSKSATIPVVNSVIELGSFQQVCLLDLSRKEGRKRVLLQVVT